MERSSEDYDPFAARPLERRTTDFAVFMHLLKASIGSGILFLPHAFRRTGYVSALVCSVVIGLISCHTAVITVQCAQILCKRIRRPMLNFAETAGASFHVGPKWIRKYASSFNVTTNIFVCFVQYETTIIYALYVATSSQQVIEHFSGYSLDTRIYIVIFFPVYCALSMIPDFKNLVPFSIMGAICLGFGFFATLYYLFIDFPDPGRLETHKGISSIPIYCSIFLFAVHNMTVLLPLENTMENPRHMPVILATTMIINMFIYIAFGFFGYNKYLDACDTVIKNLPLDDILVIGKLALFCTIVIFNTQYRNHLSLSAGVGMVQWVVWITKLPTLRQSVSIKRSAKGSTLAQLVKIAVTASVIFTYGLQYYVPITILWPFIAKRIRHDHHFEIFFRLGGVTASTLLAVAIPQMAPLLGFFAAISITTIVLLIPVLIEFSTKWDMSESRLVFCCRLIKHIIIAILWLMLLVFGASENLREIIRTFSGKGEVEADIC